MNDYLGVIILIITAIIIYFVVKISKMTPEQKAAYEQNRKSQEQNRKSVEIVKQYGHISPAMICPHCQTKGFVSTIAKKRKKGISGAKATGAVLTLGVSMLATGLSRKETMTQAHCDNCNSTWDF